MLARYISLMCFICLAVGYTPSIAMSPVQSAEETRVKPLPQKVYPVHFHDRSTRQIYLKSSTVASSSKSHFHDTLARQAHLIPVMLDSPPPIEMKEEVREMPSFTQVHIDGPFNVRVHTNKRQKPSITVRGDAIDLTDIQTRVIKHVLYVNVKKASLRTGSADLTINIPTLRKFTYKGEGAITANKIHASPLDLSIENNKNSTWSGRIGLRYLTLKGTGETKITGIYSPNLKVKLMDSPHVILRGEANLRCLNTEGDGWLNVYWVKGQSIVIRSIGATRISLAGTVERLDACFSGKTRFDGQYLRAKETFIKTNDEAVAKISSVGDQHTLARGVSDIYYYNLPERRTDFMTRDAAILDMRSDELKLIQPDQLYDH